ncbi:MAG: S46 family peptidase, partial [Rikenellaceae bacterium]|nr:S46 family peptidase [Rikenellaceae bacterium]
SLRGIQPGDFTMIIGFPGSTERHMTTYELDQLTEQDNPNRIFIRGERQKVLWEDITHSDEVRIKYASKYASSSNYWKNSIGINRGLARLKVRDQKLAIENRFRAWVAADASRSKYAEALPLIKKAVAGRRGPYNQVQYMQEALMRGIELLTVASSTQSILDMMNKNGGQVPDVPARMAAITESFYKDYSEPTDRRAAKVMFRIFAENIAPENQPSFYREIVQERFNGDYDAFTDWVFNSSVWSSPEKLQAFYHNPSEEILRNDPAYVVRESIMEIYRQQVNEYLAFNDDFTRGHRLWIAGLMEIE